MQKFVKSSSKNYKIAGSISVLTALIVLLLFSCDFTENKKTSTIYFGGEVINPKSKFIILYDKKNIRDTIYLDKNNRFFKKYDDIPEGLYKFLHQPEGQMVLLEKGDSILARVNTIEFDESLVFSGRGAKKNNFLLDMFLENESNRRENSNVRFELEPKLFLKRNDSLQKERIKKFNKIKEKVKLSNFAEKVMKASYECHFYSEKEQYSYRHFGTDLGDAKKTFEQLPVTFFKYRKQIDINDDDLRLSYDFQRFLTRYVENTCYMDFAIRNNYKEEEPNATLRKLNLIDSIFNEGYVKNIQLKGVTRQFVVFNEDSITSNKILQRFLKLNTDEKMAEYIKNVVKYTTKLVPGDYILDQKLIGSDSTTVHLTDLTKRKALTAIYFWSILDIQYYKKTHKKVTKLQEKYPEVQFISINIDEDKTKKWVNILDLKEYLQDYEYQFEDARASRNELVLDYFTRDKTILLGHNGKILNPNANIFDTQFENELRIYMKQQKAITENISIE